MTQEAPPLTRIRTRWSSASTDDQFIVENPATGQTVTVVQGTGPDELDQAVRAAHTAHLQWKRRPARERGRYLRRIAEVIRANADEIAALESLEMGKPVTQARDFDVGTGQREAHGSRRERSWPVRLGGRALEDDDLDAMARIVDVLLQCEQPGEHLRIDQIEESRLVL